MSDNSGAKNESAGTKASDVPVGHRQLTAIMYAVGEQEGDPMTWYLYAESATPHYTKGEDVPTKSKSGLISERPLTATQRSGQLKELRREAETLRRNLARVRSLIKEMEEE